MTEPVGGFSRSEFDHLDAGDPRRHHPVVVVQPPDSDGVHDNLYRISERATGNGDNWIQLLDANRGLPQPDGRSVINPSLLSPGQVLYLPDGVPLAPGVGPAAGAGPVGSVPVRPGGAALGALTGGMVTQPACTPPVPGAHPVVFTEPGRPNWAAVAAGAGGVALGAGAVATVVKLGKGHGTPSTPGTAAAPGKPGKSGTRAAPGRRPRRPRPPAHPEHLEQQPRRSYEITDYERGPGQPRDRRQPDLNRHPEHERGKLGAYAGRPGVAGPHTPGPDPTSPTRPGRPHSPHSATQGAVDGAPAPTGRGEGRGRGGLVAIPDTPDPARPARAEPAESVAEEEGSREQQADPHAMLVEIGDDPSAPDDERVIADLVGLGGLGISGPVATQALRGLITTLALTPPEGGEQPAELVIDRTLATRLFGSEPASADRVGRLRVIANVDKALSELELEVMTRARDFQRDPQTVFAPLVLCAEPTTDGHRRELAVLLAMGRKLRFAAIAHLPGTETGTDTDTETGSGGDRQTGGFPATELTLAVDGVITGATGLAGAELRGTRLPLGIRESTLALLQTESVDPGEPATADDAREPADGAARHRTAGTEGRDQAAQISAPRAAADKSGTDTAEPDKTAASATTTAGRAVAPPPAPDSTIAAGPGGYGRAGDGAGPQDTGPGAVVTDEPGWSGPELLAPAVPDTALLRITCLGPVGIQVAARTGPDASFADLDLGARRLLLCVLCARPGGVLADELLEAAWPDDSLTAARGRLHTAISNLRKELRRATGREDWILNTRSSYRLNLDHASTDLHQTEQALSRARGALHTTERRRALTDAARLITGPFATCLDGEWVEVERERRRRLHLDALHELVDLTDPPDRKITVLRGGFGVDPTDEHTATRLITALTGAGEHDNARRIYQLHAQKLDEIDLTPTTELTALAAAHPAATDRTAS
jgi:DNA-binding SARP family transcriptional activator